ncbi:MAG: sigma-70 family RNA polymerase sigma factor, partial [Candidatus Thorarchaeota archaeon]|nr:sigma-70 family RNA polymerase sigma factor [Candidatus Thorarchaeota archaeon]
MKSFRFPTKQQELIWLKRRQEIPPSQIARELKVSPPLVSKAQRIAKSRVEQVLLHTASTNRIS